MQWLTRMFSGGGSSTWAPPQPEGTLQVVGDVHGRIDLLERLLEKLDRSAPLVLVGDLIDRGDHSRQVIDVVRALPERWDAEVRCLMGNHEEMALNFLDSPEDSGPSWLRYGGLQTLASYGVAAIREGGDGAMLVKARDALAEAMGPEVMDWLEGLDLSHTSGTVTVVHAGADPAMAVSAQARRHLLWGHSDFEKIERTDGQWMCHGHTIVDAPYATRGRIAVDTGAYATGRLTAAVITPEAVEFVNA